LIGLSLQQLFFLCFGALPTWRTGLTPCALSLYLVFFSLASREFGLVRLTRSRFHYVFGDGVCLLLKRVAWLFHNELGLNSAYEFVRFNVYLSPLGRRGCAVRLVTLEKEWEPSCETSRRVERRLRPTLELRRFPADGSGENCFGHELIK
jgi:hypothetical protein